MLSQQQQQPPSAPMTPQQHPQAPVQARKDSGIDHGGLDLYCWATCLFTPAVRPVWAYVGTSSSSIIPESFVLFGLMKANDWPLCIIKAWLDKPGDAQDSAPTYAQKGRTSTVATCRGGSRGEVRISISALSIYICVHHFHSLSLSPWCS